MNKDVVEYVLLIMILSILILVYFGYVINDECKKIKYYKKVISYETEWDKYNNMLKNQKKIIFKKKLQLFYLNILVFLKGVIKWN